MENKKYSYDLTQKLTFYVISAELVFCAYILINIDKISIIQHISTLFLISSLAAFFGILWRFLYNQTFHNTMHDLNNNRLIEFFQIVSYYIYIILTIFLFISLIYLGHSYTKQKESEALSKNSISLEQTTK